MSDIIKFCKNGKPISPVGEYLIKSELKRRNLEGEPWLYDQEAQLKIRRFVEKMIENNGYDKVFIYEQMYKTADICFSIYSERHSNFKAEIDQVLRKYYPELCRDDVNLNEYLDNLILDEDSND